MNLNNLAVETAEKMKLRNTKSARWIAADALRELTNNITLERIKKKLSAD
ncbi:MAG: hypothetical protein ACR2LT_06015 [Pyrinomonadaceae bacterium]